MSVTNEQCLANRFSDIQRVLCAIVTLHSFFQMFILLLFLFSEGLLVFPSTFNKSRIVYVF